MVFSVDQYLDRDFLSGQEFVWSVQPTMPFIEPKKIKDERTLIVSLVLQNKAYCKKLIDLMEELSKSVTNRDVDYHQQTNPNQTLLNRPNSAQRQPEKGIMKNSSKKTFASPSHDSGDKSSGKSHLERKIEYLNHLVMESKQLAEEKDIELVKLRHKNEQVSNDYQNLLHQREGLEQDLNELMTEYSTYREKYHDTVTGKEQLITDLKRKLELRGYDSNSQKVGKINERDEEIEELKEKIEQKEKIISDLRSAHSKESPSKDYVSSFDSPSDYNTQIALLKDKVSKLTGMCDSFSYVFNQLGQGLTIRIDEGHKPSYRSIESSTFEQLVYIIEDQVTSRLDKFKHYGEKMVDRILQRNSLLPSSANQNSSFNETSPTPNKRGLRENITGVREEIEDRLKSTLENFEKHSHGEVIAQLQSEIEKNNEYQQKIENQVRLVHRICFVVNEEIERLQWVFDYTTRIDKIEELRSQIGKCKKDLSSLMAKSSMDRFDLSPEYLSQKLGWEDQIQEFQHIYNQEIAQLKTQLDTEKISAERTISNLSQERDRIKAEGAEADRLYKQEVERHFKRSMELESENIQINEQIKEVKMSNTRLESMIQERESTINKYSDKLNEWQTKATSLESENMATHNEVGRLKGAIHDKDREIDSLKYETRKVEDDNKFHKEMQNKLELRLREAENALDNERKVLKEANEDLQREFKKYSEDAERHQRELRQNSDKSIHELQARVDEQERYIEQIKQTHGNTIQSKDNQVYELTLAQRTQEEQIRSNQEIIKSKDDKIGQLHEEIRQLNNKNRTIESELEEMTFIKEKNKKYFDLLTNSNNDLNELKLESQQLAHDKNDAVTKLTKVEREYNNLKEELKRSREKYDECNSLQNKYRDEARLIRNELDIANERIAQAQRELKSQENIQQTQQQTQISYKDEIINKQKSDIRTITQDMELLRKEYQRITERNEDLMSENRKLRNTLREAGSQANVTKEKLLSENEILKSEVRKNLNGFKLKERTYERELTNSQRKIRDLERMHHYK